MLRYKRHSKDQLRFEFLEKRQMLTTGDIFAAGVTHDAMMELQYDGDTVERGDNTERGRGGWMLHGFDLENTNHNPFETKVSRETAPYLRRAWETFNDDALVDEGRPTDFVLESVLGLEYPSAVVGVTASPLIANDTIYYTDQLGTVFARDALTGRITNDSKHFTTTLVDPDFATDSPVLPELYYTAPVLTEDYVFLVGSANGRLHAVERVGGAEIDFDPTTDETDPFTIIEDMPFASVLGEAVVINDGHVNLLLVGVNVILNDALVQGEETGVLLAFDISDPLAPQEVWRTFSIEINQATGNRFGSGVSVGSALSVDVDRNLVFGGTGQNTTEPYPGYPNPDLAPVGFVDRSDSLYAIDYRTGEFVWINQFHNGDVFNLNDPVGTGPNNPDGFRDADVLSPPVVYSAKGDDLVAVGSKGGIYRAADRDTGETKWTRTISKPTGIGGVQAGAAFADGVLYVAGFEGIDDRFSDAQFGSDTVTGQFPNAFFATFSPQFWADVEDVQADGNPATGMRVKVYALDAATGESLWNVGGDDFVELLAGASLRHVTVANDVVYVTTTSGRLFALDAEDGSQLFTDQSPDLNEVFDLGLGKPHHASMNSGVLVTGGQVYVPFGAQNNPSGGIYVYEVNESPIAVFDSAEVTVRDSVTITPLANDSDPNGDQLELLSVAGTNINPNDGLADVIHIPEGRLEVLGSAEAHGIASITFTPAVGTRAENVSWSYEVVDIAPSRLVNGVTTGEPNPTHVARTAWANVQVNVENSPGSGVRVEGNTLFILGDDDVHDRIVVSESHATLNVNLNHTVHRIPKAEIEELQIETLGGRDNIRVNLGSARTVLIHSGEGNDRVSVRNDGTSEIYGGAGDDDLAGGDGSNLIFGDAGNDRLTGGNGRDILRGGEGYDLIRGKGGHDILLGEGDNDVLYGGNGFNILIGGLGLDQLTGGRHDDILIGSTTSHDDADAALLAILDEWITAGDVQSRIDRIQSSSTPLIAGTNVLDDSSRDRLRGKRGEDWGFLAMDDVLADGIEFLSIL